MLTEDQNTTAPDDLTDDGTIITDQNDDVTDNVEEISESDDDSEIDTGNQYKQTIDSDNS